MVADKSAIKPIQVSNAEKQERAKKGICYYCPEKWAPGHVCTTRLLSYVGDDEDKDSEDPITADISHVQSLNGS